MNKSATQECGVDKIKNHTDDLKALVDSDLPCAQLAEALIEVATGA